MILRGAFLSSAVFSVAVSIAGAVDHLQSFEKISSHSAVNVLDGGIRIRGWSYEVVPSKRNHLAITIFYEHPMAHTPEHTPQLREGDYLPVTEDYILVSTQMLPYGARSAITETVIRHRKTGKKYKFISYGGREDDFRNYIEVMR